MESISTIRLADDSVFDSAKVKSESFAPIIVVGTGPVGIRFAEELCKRGYQRELVMFGEEPWDPYNRIKLTSLLAGEIKIDDIDNNIVDIGKYNIVQHLSSRIIEIDFTRKTVVDSSNRVHRYHKLVLATGSQAHIPDIPGTNKSGVYTFRDLQDTEALRARNQTAKNIAVIGGGLLGLEAAKALKRSDVEITLVQQAPRLLNRQLDDEAAPLLQSKIEALGIKVSLGSGLAAILGDRQVEGIELRNRERIACDTVLLATGIRPNTELARKSWINVATGIRVDNQLRTSAKDVYAIGECVEHDGQVYGLVLPGYEQAAVLAKHLLDHDSQYLGSVNLAQLKVVDEAVFSVGETVELPRSSVIKQICWQSPAHGQYRKLVTERGRLVGAMAVGEYPESRRVQEAVQHHRRLRFWHLWRFRQNGHLWSEGTVSNVLSWPAESLVCQCMAITQGSLCDAVAEGKSTVAELSAATQAGTVCGGCQPLLAEMVGSDESVPIARGARKLWVSGILTLLLLVVWTLMPALKVSESVQQSLPFDLLWNNPLFKQITGYTLVGLVVIGLIMSMKKRMTFIPWGAFTSWRLVHVLTGVAALALVLVHTGFNTGSNLNFLLLINFLALVLVGALAAMLIGFEHRLSARTARWVRSSLIWGHIISVWPLPVLLSFHVVTFYYF